ncbi:PPR domain-containing protein/PPR_2 domain-containing protein, partial [Cephalotus follicularis]
IYIANSLVNLYAKCGNLAKARLVFESITNKDDVSWTCLINGYSQKGAAGASVVIELFLRMRAENIFPNPQTFAGVFVAASNISNAVGGQQAHALAIKSASFYDVFVGTSLINMYCKAGYFVDARKVFDKMPERNYVSWATMISGYAMQRLAGEAFGLFELMRREEESENEFVLTSLLSALVVPQLVYSGRQIHCLAVKNGLLAFVSVWNALVTMYGKCGCLDDALQAFELSGNKNSITWSAMITGYAQSGDSHKALRLFSKMHLSEIKPKPDIVLWTAMIGGYAQNEENEDALTLYGRMQMQGIFPNELTMASVLKACSSLAALHQGRQIHAHTIKYGLSLEVPIGSALSTMYAKCGSLTDGNLVFRRMPIRDLVTWNAMISGLSQNGCGNEALELFEEMIMEGTKPDYVTFVNILSACSHMGLVEKGKLSDAKEFIESASIDHGMCLWRILLSACRNYRNYELGTYAGEKLVELGSQESSAYVLLSSIYTALGKLEDVERVWKLMKLRGVVKEPGCSWIELKSRIHVFVVGDQLHPEIGEI